MVNLMREILFRGKRADSIFRSEWIEGSLWNNYGEVKILSALNAIGYEVIPETIGQYTGLTDKNGKKIFEGDVLVICNNREHPVLVKFLDFEWDCVIPNVNAYIHYRHRLENNNAKYEIIGNIHDNPELMKGGER